MQRTAIHAHFTQTHYHQCRELPDQMICNTPMIPKTQMIPNTMTQKLLRRTLPILLALAILVPFSARLHAQTDNSNEADQLIASFQKIENAWSDAVNNHDQFALENVLSPQFVGISAVGSVTNRDQQIAALFNKSLAPTVLSQRVITVRTYAGVDGANIALVSGTYVLKTKDGHDVDNASGIFTHVYLYSRNRWLCINAQSTIIVNQLLPKTKLVAPKK
jgi:hypothetical protein